MPVVPDDGAGRRKSGTGGQSGQGTGLPDDGDLPDGKLR